MLEVHINENAVFYFYLYFLVWVSFAGKFLDFLIFDKFDEILFLDLFLISWSTDYMFSWLRRFFLWLLLLYWVKSYLKYQPAV